jgi:hypothetical protein
MHIRNEIFKVVTGIHDVDVASSSSYWAMLFFIKATDSCPNAPCRFIFPAHLCGYRKMDRTVKKAINLANLAVSGHGYFGES